MTWNLAGTATQLFVVGKSELSLTAADIESQIAAQLPIVYQNALKIKAINVAFLEGEQGALVTVRGVVTVPTNPISVECGFGFAVRGTLRYDQASSVVYFDPVEFGQVSILPGEDIPLVETIVTTAIGAAGVVARGVGKGVGAAAGAAASGASYLGRGAGFITKRLPGFLRRGGSAVGGAVGSTVGGAVDGIGAGISIANQVVSGIIVTAARSLFGSMPIYRFKDDELGSQAKQLVEHIDVRDGMLRVGLSSERHGKLTRWRYIAGGVAVLLVALVVFFIW